MIGTGPRLAVVGGVALLAASGACSSSKDAERARLAQGCSINSECSAPYVCAFKSCHEQCASSRDCPASERCVTGDSPPIHVCQLAKERDCKRNSDCPEGQICGIDAQCRDQCVTERDCLKDQVCVSGTCGDTKELVDGGLPPGDAAPDSFVPVCVHNQDCPGTLSCLRGQCAPECITSKDCFVTWTCVATRCVPPGGPGTDAGNADASPPG